MKKTVIGIVATLVAGGMIFAQSTDVTTDILDSITAPAIETVQAAADIAAVLSETENTQIFSEAVAVADIDVADVVSEGVTVFAPVDTVVADIASISNVEDYIVPGIVTAETLASTDTLTALSGKELSVEALDGTFFINGIALNETIAEGNIVINTLNGVFADVALSLAF